ncbi:MAG: 5-(carboxyamino)imidazole ribonucleotide mutase [Oceanococcaceae bacterium]
MEAQQPVRVAVVMGSRSDWPVMEQAAAALAEFGVAAESRILSAHRTPADVHSFAESAADRGLQVIIAGAGGAAHLPGMLAAGTWIPVLGVPVAHTDSMLRGVDALLSIVQMPKGIPVPTLAIGAAGARNAGLAAVAILALSDPELARRLEAFRAEQTQRVRGEELP